MKFSAPAIRSFVKILVSLLVFSSFGFASSQSAPKPGKFDYLKFRGLYEFEKCEFGENGPIWYIKPESTFVRLTVNFLRKPFPLNAMLFEPGSPLALGWGFDNINDGIYYKRNPETGKIFGNYEEYTTENGVYGYKNWYSEASKGWSTMELFMGENEETIEYVQKVQRQGEAEPKVETCLLRRVSQ